MKHDLAYSAFWIAALFGIALLLPALGTDPTPMIAKH